MKTPYLQLPLYTIVSILQVYKNNFFLNDLLSYYSKVPTLAVFSQSIFQYFIFKSNNNTQFEYTVIIYLQVRSYLV